MKHTGSETLTGRSGRLFLFVVGFAIVANFLALRGAGVRLLDLVGLLGAAIFLFRIGFQSFLRDILWVFLVLGFFALQLARGLLIGDPSMVYASARIMLSVMTAVTVGGMIHSEPRNIGFFLGGALGGLIVAFIAYGQAMFPGSVFMIFAPPDAPSWWYGGHVRAVGIWEHPNGLAQCQALGVAYALNLAYLRSHGWVRLLGLGICLLTVGLTYVATQTRAFLVVSLILLLIVMNFGGAKRTRPYRQLLTVFAFALLPFVLSSLLGDRFFGHNAQGMGLADNLLERLATWLDSLGLLLANPLGYGFEGRMEAQLRMTGNLAASHNAYLSLSLTFGLLAGLLVVAAIVITFRRILRTGGGSSPALLPLIAMTIMFFAEDSLFSLSMQMALAVAFFSAARPIFVSRRPRRPRIPTTFSGLPSPHPGM